MSSRPRIGITTSRHKSLVGWCFDRLAVWRAGGQPVRLMPGGPLPPLERLDGLILGGGDDIGAELYGGKILPDIRIDPARDQLERDLLEQALTDGMPVLGICRGAQMINVHLGGTLIGDIFTSHPGKQRLRTVLPRLDIRIKPDSRLGRVTGLTIARVNALHHQAVDRLGRGLRITARDGHGIAQAFERPGEPFLLGVQWHPEFLVFDRAQQAIIRALVQAAAAGRASRYSRQVT